MPGGRDNAMLEKVARKLTPVRASVIATAGLLALCLPLSTRADPSAGLGPLKVGTPFEELQQTLPEVPWVASNPWKHSGKPRWLVAASGIRIADLPFGAQLTRGYHGAYSISLEHTSAAADADDCEQRARAVFIAVEPQTGPMDPSGELIDNEYAEPIGARSSVKLSQTLDEAMRKPVSRDKLRGRQPAHRWWRATGYRNDDTSPIEFHFQMNYSRQRLEQACGIRLEARREATPPPPLRLPWAEMKPSRSPSIALRHLLVSRLALSTPLPAAGVTMTLTCRIDRSGGQVLSCDPPQDFRIKTAAESAPSAAEAALRRAASQLARDYRFDLANQPGLDLDDPAPLIVDIPLQLQNADVRTLTNTESAIPMAAANFKWAAGASAAVLERLYPTRALRAGEQSAVALVCRIEEDFSPVCAPIQQDPRPTPDFEWAALEILTHYRAQPMARDGSTTVGRLVLQQLQFRLAD